MPTQPGRDAELADKLQDPFLRRSVKTALHLRRYMPFYVFGLIWVVTLAAFPSIRDGGNDDTVTAASTEFADDTTGIATDTGTDTTAAVDPAVEGAVDAGTAAAPEGTTAAPTGGGGNARPAPTKATTAGGAPAPGGGHPGGVDRAGEGGDPTQHRYDQVGR